jgi:predicted XRE-type DNA-binding protein
VKIRSVRANNHKHAFEVSTRGRSLSYPYARCEPHPTTATPVVDVSVDEELAREGFTYELASGEQGSVHIEQVLEYHRDPGFLRDLLLDKLTIETQDRVETCGLSRREIIRRLGTSPAQFYRLLDAANRRKSVDKMLLLLHALDCEVDLVVRGKSA